MFCFEAEDFPSQQRGRQFVSNLCCRLMAGLAASFADSAGGRLLCVGSIYVETPPIPGKSRPCVPRCGTIARTLAILAVAWGAQYIYICTVYNIYIYIIYTVTHKELQLSSIASGCFEYRFSPNTWCCVQTPVRLLMQRTFVRQHRQRSSKSFEAMLEVKIASQDLRILDLRTNNIKNDLKSI